VTVLILVLILVLVALIGALLLIASGAPTAIVSSASPPAKTSTTVSAADAEDTYLAAVRSEFRYSSRADLIKVGKAVCEAIDGYDGDVGEFLEYAARNVDDQKGAAAVIAAAVPAFCPEYQEALDEAIDN
jgi:Na+-transporting methylmalonyl-CoA/oxaloacetate decarboxylase gamma subunit